MIDGGYQAGSYDMELDRAEARLEFDQIRTIMDKKDPNIAEALIMKEVYGYTVSEIARKLNVTERQVYYLISQAKDIGKQYAKKNR